MDDIRDDALEAMDALISHLRDADTMDFEAAEAWLAWSAAAQAVRSGALGEHEVRALCERARRACGVALPA